MDGPPTNSPAQPTGHWLRALKEQVQPVTFKKGRDYAEAQRVAQIHREADKLTAKVAGSENERYEVELEIGSAAKLSSHCSCAAWNRYGPHCKHVVAVALVYLARTSQPQGPLAKEPSRETTALPALAKLEDWLGLSTLPEIEFIYRLTPVRGPTGGRHWVVDVRRADSPGKGPVQVRRLLSAGTRVAVQDERVLSALSSHEARFDGRILLNDEDLCELVELLRPRKVIYRGTALQFSPEPARPQVHLSSQHSGAVARLELLMPNGDAVPLKELSVLSGRRSYALHGQVLYGLEPELPQRLLRKWQLEPETALPNSQLDRALIFFAAHLPRFRLALKAEGVQVDETTQPRFILTVEGAPERVRATLAGRYGQSSVPISPSAVHLGYAAGEGGKKLYRRQEETERAAGRVLLDLGFKYESATQQYEATFDAAIDFWSKGLAALPSDWEVFGAKSQKVRLRPRVKPRVRVGMSGVDWFELDADFVTDDQSVDLGAVRLWLDSGRRYVPLKDGSFAEADAAELKRAADLLEEAGALPGTRRTRLPLYQAPALDLLTSLGETELEAKARKAITALREIDGIPPVKPPDGFLGQLRHYQESGLAWLWFLHKHRLAGILADDMGLGKTVQALSVLLKSKKDEGPKPSLVVAPTSVLANWEREAERFTPELSVVIWHGQERRSRAEKLTQADLVLTSYALVRRDGAELAKVGFRYVILDEAQNIKNADSATAQACKSIPSEQKLALTGTPLENRLAELWSLFDFLMPGFLGTADTFSDRFEHPIQVAGDLEVRDRLRRRIHPFVLRRLKGEVEKDLPPKLETVAWCEMDPGQAALYREVLEESRRKVYESIDKVGFGRSRLNILAALMRMRQVCCDPRLLKLPPGTLLPGSAKLERCKELIADLVAEGHRALVFSQFTEMLSLLKDQADAEKVGYLYLDGRTRDRMERVDAFNDPAGPPLFFISLKAGGTGLNLTAADYVIHYDPWWNPAVEDQATDRAHRIGQTRPVISYKLITRGTVEEKILGLQQRKRELAKGVLGADAELGKVLTEADVEELFRID